MFKIIISIFKSETVFFADTISANVRRLIYSDVFNSIASPLVNVFLSAFIWQTTGSLFSVAVYKLGEYLFLPTTFFINGFLLRKVGVRATFVAGSLLAGIMSAVLVVFATHSNGWLFVYGALWGIGNGMYWANRNYLELEETVAEARDYFFGLLSSIGGIASIVVPLVGGWFIVASERLGWFTSLEAYWILFGISFLCMAACARVIAKSNFTTPKPTTISRLSIRPFINKRRLLQIAQGLLDSVSFIPGLIVLYLLGNEGALGTTAAIASIVCIIATYLYCRFAKQKDESKTLVAGSVFFALCSTMLFILPRDIGVTIYVLVAGIGITFFTIASASKSLCLADEELGSDETRAYSFIFDNELFLNAGRVLGTSTLIVATLWRSQLFGLFYGQLFVVGLHLVLLALFFAIKKNDDACAVDPTVVPPDGAIRG